MAFSPFSLFPYLPHKTVLFGQGGLGEKLFSNAASRVFPQNVFFLFLLTIHLPLVAEYDLPPAAGRVYGERLLEALLDLWRPNSLRVGTRHLLVVVELGGVELGDLPE